MLTLAVMDEVFEPRPLPAEPFPNSLGVNSGAPQRVVVEFEPDAAPYIREREWHPSQQLEDRGDGGTVLTMNVCNDRPLRAWILGFGASARVIEPVDLAKDVFDAANAVRARYLKTAAAERLAVVSMRAS
jgi:predicted DNA-binding transcriptional regulator YafY